MKNISIGENDLENEKMARCTRIKNRYLLNAVKNKSCSELSAEFAKNVNLGISTKTFLRQNNITPKIAKDLIYIKIFNYAKHSKYETKFAIFTEKEYETYIRSNSK